MKDSLDTVHKGLGLHEDDLRESLGPELCARWGIGEQDSVATVREKAVDRFSAAIGKHVAEPMREIALAWFNVAGPGLARTNFEDRVTLIGNQHGDNHSLTTLKRKLREPVARVLDALRTGTEDTDGDEAWMIRSSLREVLRMMNEPDQAPKLSVRLFATGSWLVPTAEQTRFHIAHPPGEGLWLCAFSSLARYDAYRNASGAPWRGEPAKLSGAELAGQLHERFPTAGLLCDPPDRIDGPGQHILCLPAADVADIARS